MAPRGDSNEKCCEANSFLLLLADRVIGSYESAFIDSDVVLAKKCEILLTDDTSENSLVQNSQ